MRRVALSLILLFAARVTAGSWGTSCAGGSCSVPDATPECSFRGTDATDQVAVFRGGVQLGIWRVDRGKFYALPDWREQDCPAVVPAQYAARAEKPCPVGFPDCKCGCRSGEPCTCAAGDWKTRGVENDKLDAPGYTLSGRRVTRAEAMAAVEASVPDDAKKLRLTLIGPEADRSKVLAELTTAGNYVVNSYPPDAWQIKDYGFVTTGKPTIYLQTPDGKVLHRQDDYTGGATALSEALRKADPSYDPNKDVDARKPKPAPPAPIDDKKPAPDVPVSGGMDDVHLCCFGAIGLAALWLSQRKEQVSQ